MTKMGITSVRRLSVCATGRPSLPRALDLGATHDLFAPLRDAAAVLRASRALFWRTTGSPTITGRRVDVLAGGLRPPARTYASRGLRASASLSLARSAGKKGTHYLLLTRRPPRDPAGELWAHDQRPGVSGGGHRARGNTGRAPTQRGIAGRMACCPRPAIPPIPPPSDLRSSASRRNSAITQFVMVGDRRHDQ